jgi:hypothetical protein
MFCAFEMQHTFSASEGEHDAGADPDSVEPTAEAFKALEIEVEDYLSKNYSVDGIEISTDSDLVLHTPGDPHVG